MKQEPHVLLVEDDLANRMLARRILATLGLPFTETANGVEALAAMARQQADLVLMDLSMPGMDGLEAARRIRANPDWAETPIIALTANARPADREQAFAAGCDAVVLKPYRPDDLAEAIGRVMGGEAGSAIRFPG